MGKIIWEPYDIKDINWKARSLSEALSREVNETQLSIGNKKTNGNPFTSILLTIILIFLMFLVYM